MGVDGKVSASCHALDDDSRRNEYKQERNGLSYFHHILDYHRITHAVMAKGVSLSTALLDVEGDGIPRKPVLDDWLYAEWNYYE